VVFLGREIRTSHEKAQISIPLRFKPAIPEFERQESASSYVSHVAFEELH